MAGTIILAGDSDPDYDSANRLVSRLKGEKMEIEYGAEVRDKNGKVLGKVVRIIRNSWTGEVSKFQVSQGKSDTGLFFSTEDVAGATASEVKLKVAVDESQEK